MVGSKAQLQALAHGDERAGIAPGLMIREPEGRSFTLPPHSSQAE